MYFFEKILILSHGRYNYLTIKQLYTVLYCDFFKHFPLRLTVLSSISLFV